MKKVISLILCLLMLGSCFAYADTIEGSRTVIGADLDEEDIAFVYKQFGIDRGDVKELSVTNAEERAKAMVAQEQIVKLAQEKAAEIIAHAQTKSREMRKAAQEFVDDLMCRADEELTTNLGEIRKTRAALRQQVPTANTQQNNNQ